MLQRNWTAQPARKECLALLAHEPVGEQGGGVRVRRVLVDHEVKGGDGDRRLEVRAERKTWEFPLLGDAVVHVLVGRYGVVARDHQPLPLSVSAPKGRLGNFRFWAMPSYMYWSGDMAWS